MCFESVEWHSIRDQVYAPFSRYATQRLKGPVVVERMHPLMLAYWKAGPVNTRACDPFDDAIITAEKAR